MREYDYRSAFADDIRNFIAFKADVGIASDSRNWHLRDFDRWCVRNGAERFDQGTVEGWVLARKRATSADHLSWMSYVRELGRYLRANGHPEAYVLTDESKARMVRVQPYLLSQEEIEAFFGAAASFRSPRSWLWQGTAFFGLMHSCGLRTCEARKPGVGDVDLDARRIDIRRSKGHRSRRLSISDEMRDLLRECGERADFEFGPDRSAFFVSTTSNPVAPSQVGVGFKTIWQAAGLPDVKNGKRPRPYDFRHHFAYANLERWRKEDVNVESMMPYLARYMGHATFDSTYYYVHTSPDFLGEYAGIVDAVNDLVIPEVVRDV